MSYIFWKLLFQRLILAFNESFLSILHPTRRQIFANTVGRICKLNLTLRRNYFFMKGGRLASPPFFQLNSSWNTWRAWAVASYWVWRHQRGQCPPRHDSSHWQKGTANQRQNSRIEVIFHPLFQSFIIKLCIYHLHCYNRIQVQLLCLLTPSLLLLAFVQLGFAKNVRLTSLSY